MCYSDAKQILPTRTDDTTAQRRATPKLAIASGGNLSLTALLFAESPAPLSDDSSGERCDSLWHDADIRASARLLLLPEHDQLVVDGMRQQFS